MDPVTHAAIACMAVSVDRRTRAATGPLLPILGGLAPDVDAVLMPVGWDVYLRAHEIGTHSLAGVLTLSVVVTGLFAFRRRSPARWVFAASLLAVCSHVALDVLSGATVQLGWPLWTRRTASFGLVAMADPWFVAPIAAALTIVLSRRRSLAVVAPYTLALLAALLGAKLVSRHVALERYSTAADGTRAVLIEPAWGSLTGWRVFDRTATRVRKWRVDAATGRAAIEIEMPAADSGSAARERQLRTIDNFASVHELPVRVSTTRDRVTRVLWSDLRFCWRPERGHAIGAPGRPTADPIACAVWFGGDIDAEGRPVREFVLIGSYVQAR